MKTHTKIFSFALSLIVLLNTSCASIISKSTYPLSVSTSPSDAQIVIIDKKGNEIYKGTTPAKVDLKSGSGFFGKAAYSVKISKNGYESKTIPVHFKLDGWYFGNLLIGGVLGMLIIDPATGAMYKLETKYINENLSPQTASTDNLTILTTDAIPSEWKNHLEKISK
jgi:hypothetical protein